MASAMASAMPATGRRERQPNAGPEASRRPRSASPQPARSPRRTPTPRVWTNSRPKGNMALLRPMEGERPRGNVLQH